MPSIPIPPTTKIPVKSIPPLVAILLVVIGSFALPARAADQADNPVTPKMRQAAVAVLRESLSDEESWTKVHTAEALIRLDYRRGVKEEFDQELAEHGQDDSYRIGIWRVLAQLTYDPSERDRWVGKIREAFLDLDGPDRVNAAETLGKLGYTVSEEDGEAFAVVSEGTPGIFVSMTRWVLAGDGANVSESKLVDLLDTDDEQTRLGAAYALRYRKTVSPSNWARLAAAADREPTDSHARPFLLAAAFVLAPDDKSPRFKRMLVEYARTGDKDARYELCEALADRGDGGDLGVLTALMKDSEADVRVAAANAVLRIGRRVGSSMAALDWVVIGVYLLGMLAVGWYYARRTTSTEDYLLGGRDMKSWTVGLSLFATLLSTLSYLFIPGEMIKYGPMILTQLAMYPLIVLVVGWFLIPQFMKLKVTTAYEILETRLGVSVRLLGSVIFLLLRLLWMGVIIYATTDKVLVPMMGLSPEMTPWICVALGTITVFYTSMGGLRAVVLTDVVQTFILFGGAILAIVTITVAMGGVGAWWPHQWSAGWSRPAWFDLDARVSFLGASIGVFFWWICTAGSDQMAIQRYLATRDAKAARRAFTVAMIADASVCLFLAALGFALLAYFQAHPYMIPDGETIYTGADKLFPKYIVLGLPVGISGLIVAGLLAAAMSSLSSGINASCSVITVDFIDRFRKSGLTERGHVRMAQYMSVLVGAVVVGLSFYVSVVPGNLLEVVYKVVNLFTGTLFVLFFLAMFVPRATALSAWAAALCSTTVAVMIAYWELFTGRPGISFLWITPASLATGIAVGVAVSFLPAGTRPRAKPA
jgi:solute:Na+ symporter, SSS family